MFGAFDQIGYVVDDLDRAVAARLALGIGPWTIFRNTVLRGVYRGVETVVRIDVALAYRDRLQLELIAPHDDAPSPYVGARGPHHLAWLVDDLDAAVAEARSRGLTLAFAAGNDAVRVAYLESPTDPGGYYELIEGADMRGMIEAGIAAAEGWTGGDPIREIDMAAE